MVKLWTFIRDYAAENGKPPSLREMSAALGQGHSTSVIAAALKRLEKDGRVVREGFHKWRSVAVNDPYSESSD